MEKFAGLNIRSFNSCTKVLWKYFRVSLEVQPSESSLFTVYSYTPHHATCSYRFEILHSQVIGVSYLLELTYMHAVMVNSGLRSDADFKVLLETN